MKYDVHSMHTALREVHKFKDITTRQRMGTIYYSVVQAHQWKAAPRVARGDYPKMDETNDCQHEIFDGVEWPEMFMTPEEIQIKRWKEERELHKSFEE